MRRRAHRSAYVLLVRPLQGAEYRKACMTWAQDAVFEKRGRGSIEREMRRRGVRWSVDETLKIHYSPRLLSYVMFEQSPLFAMIPARRASPENGSG